MAHQACKKYALSTSTWGEKGTDFHSRLLDVDPENRFTDKVQENGLSIYFLIWLLKADAS